MRKLYLSLSFAAMAVFVACDGSGTNADSGLSINSSNSSSEAGNKYDGEVEELGELPKCTEKKDGNVYYVEEEDITYTCRYDEEEETGEWVRKKKKTRNDDKLPEKVKTVEEATKLDCNADLKCQMVFVEEFTDNFFCDGKEVRPYSPIMDAKICPAGTGDDDISNVSMCAVSREGDQVLVKIVADGITDNMTLTIDDEGVVTEVSKFDATISKADFDKSCREAKEEPDVDVLSTECDESAKTITQTYKEEDVKTVDQLEAMNELMCDMMLHPEGFLKDIEDAIEKANDDDDDESNRSIADICADGLSEDCLIGTWTLKSISQKGNGEVINDFSSAPGTMVFQDDGIYRYSRSFAGNCLGVDKGEWSISEDGKNLTFFENKEGDCIDFMKKYATTPSIEVSGNTVTLKLNKVVFQQDESDGMYAGNDTEVFVRVE